MSNGTRKPSPGINSLQAEPGSDSSHRVGLWRDLNETGGAAGGPGRNGARRVQAMKGGRHVLG